MFRGVVVSCVRRQHLESVQEGLEPHVLQPRDCDGPRQLFGIPPYVTMFHEGLRGCPLPRVPRSAPCRVLPLIPAWGLELWGLRG
jgi:hypothetical protein